VRPTLYEAYHEILPVVKSQTQNPKPKTQNPKPKTQKFDVVGPICESGDFFAIGRTMAEPKEKDVLAIMGAGAYGFSMASNYNSRPRSCEVLVDGASACEIREREDYRDLVKGEVIPQTLL